MFSIDFDNLPDYEPLEFTLQDLRTRNNIENAFNKLLALDCGELIEHPQWDELLCLLYQFLTEEGEKVNDEDNDDNNNLLILLLCIHIKLLAYFDGQLQFFDIALNVLNFILHSFVSECNFAHNIRNLCQYTENLSNSSENDRNNGNNESKRRIMSIIQQDSPQIGVISANILETLSHDSYYELLLSGMIIIMKAFKDKSSCQYNDKTNYQIWATIMIILAHGSISIELDDDTNESNVIDVDVPIFDIILYKYDFAELFEILGHNLLPKVVFDLATETGFINFLFAKITRFSQTFTLYRASQPTVDDQSFWLLFASLSCVKSWANIVSYQMYIEVHHSWLCMPPLVNEHEQYYWCNVWEGRPSCDGSVGVRLDLIEESNKKFPRLAGSNSEALRTAYLQIPDDAFLLSLCDILHFLCVSSLVIPVSELNESMILFSTQSTMICYLSSLSGLLRVFFNEMIHNKNSSSFYHGIETLRQCWSHAFNFYIAVMNTLLKLGLENNPQVLTIRLLLHNMLIVYLENIHPLLELSQHSSIDEFDGLLIEIVQCCTSVIATRNLPEARCIQHFANIDGNIFYLRDVGNDQLLENLLKFLWRCWRVLDYDSNLANIHQFICMTIIYYDFQASLLDTMPECQDNIHAVMLQTLTFLFHVYGDANISQYCISHPDCQISKHFVQRIMKLYRDVICDNSSQSWFSKVQQFLISENSLFIQVVENVVSCESLDVIFNIDAFTAIVQHFTHQEEIYVYSHHSSNTNFEKLVSQFLGVLSVYCKKESPDILFGFWNRIWESFGVQFPYDSLQHMFHILGNVWIVSGTVDTFDVELPSIFSQLECFPMFNIFISFLFDIIQLVPNTINVTLPPLSEEVQSRPWLFLTISHLSNHQSTQLK